MKKKKYAFGSMTNEVNNANVKKYMTSPAEAVAKNQEAVADAMFAGASDPLAMGLGIASKGAGFASGLMGGGGDLGAAFDFASQLGGLFAMGGTVGAEQVEVEGKEVIQTPDGKVSKVKGASHENGGVDMVLPEGTNVFSDRITVRGETMAERKAQRTKKLEKAQKALDKNPTDQISKNTYDRLKSIVDTEEMKDLQLQQAVTQVMAGMSKAKAAYGLLGNLYGNDKELESDLDASLMDTLAEMEPLYAGDPTLSQDLDINVESLMEDYAPEDIVITPEGGEDDSSGDNKKGGVTFGDVMGLSGDLFSTFAPYLHTMKQRAGDTANINAYEGFGEDALEAVGQAQSYVKGQRDEALSDIDLSTKAAQTTARGQARGLNTMRAMQLGLEQQANRSRSDVYSNAAAQMMQLLSQKAGLEQQQDQVVMGGEQARDLADRQDRDAFSTALAKNISTIGQGLQETGKDVNAMKQNDVVMNLLSQLSKYGLEIDDDGNVKQAGK